MGKSDSEVVEQFNEIVNMTVDELDAWLKTETSQSGAGWTPSSGPKSSNNADGEESVGHQSGRKIMDILKRNPEKEASKYTDEDRQHMRKVVAYCARHMAQEGRMQETKTPEELEKTKSTISLKNWGHDPVKSMKSGGKKNTDKKDDDGPAKGASKNGAKKERTEGTRKSARTSASKENGKETAKAPEKPKETTDGEKDDDSKPAAKRKSGASTDKKPSSAGKKAKKAA